jgi:signal transduction histidine kinase
MTPISRMWATWPPVWRPVLARDGVDLRTAVGSGPFTVQAQPDLIDRLKSSSQRARPRGGGGSGQRRLGAGNLRVDDSGPGIPEDRQTVDRFHRATDTVAGTGLGLAIRDSVVRSTQGVGR